jgi:hypothetical protein
MSYIRESSMCPFLAAAAAALKSAGVKPSNVAGAIAAVPNALATIGVLKTFADSGDANARAEIDKIKRAI